MTLYLCSICDEGPSDFNPENHHKYRINAYSPEAAAGSAVAQDASRSAESPESYIDQYVAVKCEGDAAWTFYQVTEVDYSVHVNVKRAT
jgi:hypothetical protein